MRPITYKEAQERYGVPHRTLTRWVSTGQVRRAGTRKHGNGRPHVLLTEADVKRLARGRKEQDGNSGQKQPLRHLGTSHQNQATFTGQEAPQAAHCRQV